MDKRIDKIIDRLLDDCLAEPASANAKLDNKDMVYNYPFLSEKDLLTITQNFLEFKYAKMTRTSLKEADGKAPTVDY